MRTRMMFLVTAALFVLALPTPPCRGADLYVLSIGVEPTWTFQGRHDLYAGDAGFVGEAFVRAEGLYAHTHRRVVAGKQATREAVLEGFAWLGRSVGEEDVAVVFFSTHGDGDSKTGHEVFLYGAGGEDTPFKSTEMRAALDAVKGRTVVLMDTCTAGGMIPPASQLGKRTAFFAGCTATESTGGQYQRADRPHGWFVIALCEALAGKADTDGDRVVTLGEVEKYLPGRAKEFRRAQNAFLVGTDDIRKLPLVRVDPANPAIELFTARKKEPGRNPFGEPDVSDPDGADVQAFATKTKLEGGKDDPNATAWPDKDITGPMDNIEGPWASRWNSGTPEDWMGDKAEIKVVGDRVYILYAEDYLFDLKRTGEKKEVLAGRYVSLSDATDTSPWVGIIVGSDRIDGHWPQGRWDFRRTGKSK
jgi:hypothetical protein